MFHASIGTVVARVREHTAGSHCTSKASALCHTLRLPRERPRCGTGVWTASCSASTDKSRRELGCREVSQGGGQGQASSGVHRYELWRTQATGKDLGGLQTL